MCESKWIAAQIFLKMNSSLNNHDSNVKSDRINRAINILFLVPNEVGGTEYHARSYIDAFGKIDKKNKYIVFVNKEAFPTFSKVASNISIISCPVSGRSRVARILYEQFVLPIQLLLHNCSVLHSFGYWGVIFSPIRQVVSIHDVNWRDHPEDMNLLTRIVTKALCELSLFIAAAIVTSSSFSKKRLLCHFRWSSKKVFVIKSGIDEQLINKLENAENLNSLKKYILCVSPFYPHKRIHYLLDVWQEITKLHSDITLVLVGRRGRDESSVLQRITQLENIQHVPKVSLDRLAQLYRGANAFVFPSAYEGFGYPVYEAAAAGLPIVVAKKHLYDASIYDRLSEFTGNAKQDAELVVSCMHTGAKSLDTNLTTQFSYSRAAKQLITLHDKVIESKKS